MNKITLVLNYLDCKYTDNISIIQIYFHLFLVQRRTRTYNLFVIQGELIVSPYFRKVRATVTLD